MNNIVMALPLGLINFILFFYFIYIKYMPYLSIKNKSNKGTGYSGQIKLGTRTFQNITIGGKIGAINLGYECPNYISKRYSQSEAVQEREAVSDAYMGELIGGSNSCRVGTCEPKVRINCCGGQVPPGLKCNSSTGNGGRGNQACCPKATVSGGNNVQYFGLEFTNVSLKGGVYAEYQYTNSKGKNVYGYFPYPGGYITCCQTNCVQCLKKGSNSGLTSCGS